MANGYYSEHDTRKASVGGGAPPKTGQRGKKPASTPYKCPSWGENIGKTQAKDRSRGMTRVAKYAKSKGL